MLQCCALHVHDAGYQCCHWLLRNELFFMRPAELSDIGITAWAVCWGFLDLNFGFRPWMRFWNFERLRRFLISASIRDWQLTLLLLQIPAKSAGSTRRIRESRSWTMNWEWNRPLGPTTGTRSSCRTLPANIELCRIWILSAKTGNRKSVKSNGRSRHSHKMAAGCDRNVGGNLTPAGRVLFFSWWNSIFKCKSESAVSYRHDAGSEDGPANGPEFTQTDAHHFVNAVRESLRAEYPRYRNCLKEADEEQTHSAGRVEVHQLEYVRSALENANENLNSVRSRNQTGRILTCVTIGTPNRNKITHIPRVILFLWGRKLSAQLSMMPVMNDSTMQNSLSMPRICKTQQKFIQSANNPGTNLYE